MYMYILTEFNMGQHLRGQQGHKSWSILQGSYKEHMFFRASELKVLGLYDS